MVIFQQHNPLNHLFLIVFLAFFLPSNLGGHPGQEAHLEGHGPQKAEELYFSFERPGAGHLYELGKILSFCELTSDSVYAYANSVEYALFLEMGIPHTLLPHPGDVDFELNMLCVDDLLQRDLTETWDFYPTFEGYVALMYQFEQDYPDLVEIVEIGESVLGRELLFAKISPNVQSRRPVPQFMYTSTMHGDETAGFILSLRLIHYLVTHYGVDDEITGLMDQVEIWICPNENPDGTYRYDNSTVAGATRGNINGVDLNRNYPNPVNDPWHAQQVETTAMINFTDTMNFVMSANMHGGIELVNFPFDSWTSPVNTHADHDWWEFVMYEYVDTVHQYSPPGYMTGMGDGVTHGGDWYVIYGSRQDYFNYYKSCREFTLELSNIKLLPPHLLPDHWDWNYRSMLNYIRQSTFGIHGMVYDNETGEPLLAELSIPSYDSDGSEVWTALPHGNYNRPLLAGSYDLRFTAGGYPTLDVEGVAVENYQTTRLNIGLGEGVTGELAEVSIHKEGEGAITPFEGTERFTVGANVFLQAEAAIDWHFSHWLIDGTQYDDPSLVIPVTGDMSITAVFQVMETSPEILLVPEEIAFGVGVIGQSYSRELRIKNTGNVPLEVFLVDIEGDEVFYVDHPVASGSFQVDPDQEEIVTIYFEPQHEVDYTAEMVIESNDPESPLVTADITGTGLLEAAILSLEPSPMDFGEMAVGLVDSLELLVLNAGNLDLTISDIEQDGNGAFLIHHMDLPISLEASEQVSIMVYFSPQAPGQASSQAIFHSNAQDEPEHVFQMLGYGLDPTHVQEIAPGTLTARVYPNPLNESSLLKLELTQEDHVQLRVMDLYGKWTFSLYDGRMEPGEHRFAMPGSLFAAPAGLYVLTVRSSDSLLTLKLIKP